MLDIFQIVYVFPVLNHLINNIFFFFLKEYPVEEETLADTFYALTSALSRSVDLEHASIFVRDILISALVEKDLVEIWCPEDPLEILNDILDREHKELAEPRIIAESGANTLIPVYQIGVYTNEEFLGSGNYQHVS